MRFLSRCHRWFRPREPHIEIHWNHSPSHWDPLGFKSRLSWLTFSRPFFNAAISVLNQPRALRSASLISQKFELHLSTSGCVSKMIAWYSMTRRWMIARNAKHQRYHPGIIKCFSLLPYQVGVSEKHGKPKSSTLSNLGQLSSSVLACCWLLSFHDSTGWIR